WGRALKDGDALASVQRVGPTTWSAHETFPFHLARRGLGIGDDLAFRRTMMRAVAAAQLPIDVNTRKLRGPIETGLARIERQDVDRARASPAADHLGVLLFTDPE